MPEVMRPSLVSAPDRISIPSAFLSPDFSKKTWPPKMQTVYDSSPSSLIQETELSPDFSGIQQKIKKEWIPTRGEVPTSDLVTVFKEKSLLMALELQGLAAEELDMGITDPDKRARIIRKISNAATGCVDILTDMGFDVRMLVNDKLDIVDGKYNADKFTELRLYGTVENPGRMSVRDVAAYMKRNYDKETGVQGYELRGLPIPVEEEEARFICLDSFMNWEQMRVAEWQARAFGIDFSVSGSILNNMLGEHNEFLDEFKGLTPEQINSIGEGKKRNNIGEEGADFLIGSMGVLAAWEECVQKRIAGTVEKMKHDYKKAPVLRERFHLPPTTAMRVIREQKYRLKKNLKPSYRAALLLNVVR